MNNNYRYLISLLICLFLVLLVGCSETGKDEEVENLERVNIEYNFNTSSDGFIVNKTDVPANYSDDEYEFEYDLEEIPFSGNKTKALMLSYNNKNADMFSYVFKEINPDNNIEKNTTYFATMTFDVATTLKNENSYIKAGVVSRLPLPNEGEERIAFNLDKGEDDKDGVDLKNLGNLEDNNKVDNEYKLHSYEVEMEVTSSREGTIYAIIGLDSEYEGEIKYYIDNVKIRLNKVNQ